MKVGNLVGNRGFTAVRDLMSLQIFRRCERLAAVWFLAVELSRFLCPVLGVLVQLVFRQVDKRHFALAALVLESSFVQVRMFSQARLSLEFLIADVTVEEILVMYLLVLV